METISALLDLCAGTSPVTGEFPSQRPVTRSFGVFFICAWINCWVNNRKAGDLRCHRAHYDVTVTQPSPCLFALLDLYNSWIRTGNLTHWGRVTHICVGKLNSIGSDNGLSPGRRQAIIWTNAGILLIGPLGTNFTEILIEIRTFSLKKISLKMSSAKCRPFVSASMS